MVYASRSGSDRRASLPARLSCALLALSVSGGAAEAQNLFEMLFGPPPSRRAPPPPPGGPMPPGNVGRSYFPPSGQQPPPEAGFDPSAPRAPPSPIQPKPVLLSSPSEDTVIGRDLKLNGTSGNLRIERTGAGALRAVVTLAGSRVSNPVESCTIPLSGGQPLNLASEGRVENLVRLKTEAAVCPITFDVLDGAVLVDAKTPVCEIAESDCKAEIAGLWGPESASLVARAKDYEQQRGTADKAVRENYKALTQRAQPQAVRPIVSEQAAFSADREQVCRSYLREGTHGFCNARYTEGRALVLASRLGMTIAAQAASAQRRSSRRSSPVADLPED